MPDPSARWRPAVSQAETPSTNRMLIYRIYNIGVSLLKWVNDIIESKIK